MEENFSTILGILTGLGLAAACGFRVFVPFLIASIAIRADVIHVAADFAWMGSTPALVALGVATLLEVGGYCLPGVDHFLDVVATPVAVVAGTLLTASFITDMEPWFRWSLAAIAGGGAAAVVQTTTVAARATSAVLSLGFGNPIVSAAEFLGATTVSILAALAPILALIAVVVAVALLWSLRRRRAEPMVASRPAGWGSQT
ncbi:MAG: DUF4126 domain-containing protein [Planctomycetes bacterium]|nr:DUF4126 domain-containing protein [Planctomycetota bacterium]